MSVILDLLGSVVIAGFVILIGLRLNQTIAGNADASKANVNVQESMVEIVRTIEYDFRKIGYKVPEEQWAIIDTSSTMITFLSDIDDNGAIDVVKWWAGPKITTLPNPNTVMLYRQVNSETPTSSNLGVTNFKLRFLDQEGKDPDSFGGIYIIEITLQVESPYKVQDQVNPDLNYDEMGYAVAFWRQTRLASRNIKRHG
jgi:hypothetical protein